jgi:hypothetical protein
LSLQAHLFAQRLHPANTTAITNIINHIHLYLTNLPNISHKLAGTYSHVGFVPEDTERDFGVMIGG